LLSGSKSMYRHSKHPFSLFVFVVTQGYQLALPWRFLRAEFTTKQAAMRGWDSREGLWNCSGRLPVLAMAGVAPGWAPVTLGAFGIAAGCIQNQIQ